MLYKQTAFIPWWQRLNAKHVQPAVLTGNQQQRLLLNPEQQQKQKFTLGRLHQQNLIPYLVKCHLYLSDD